MRLWTLGIICLVCTSRSMIQRFVAAAFGLVAERATLLCNKSLVCRQCKSSTTLADNTDIKSQMMLDCNCKTTWLWTCHSGIPLPYLSSWGQLRLVPAVVLTTHYKCPYVRTYLLMTQNNTTWLNYRWSVSVSPCEKFGIVQVEMSSNCHLHYTPCIHTKHTYMVAQ